MWACFAGSNTLSQGRMLAIRCLTLVAFVATVGMIEALTQDGTWLNAGARRRLFGAAVARSPLPRPALRPQSLTVLPGQPATAVLAGTIPVASKEPMAAFAKMEVEKENFNSGLLRTQSQKDEIKDLQRIEKEATVSHQGGAKHQTAWSLVAGIACIATLAIGLKKGLSLVAGSATTTPLLRQPSRRTALSAVQMSMTEEGGAGSSTQPQTPTLDTTSRNSNPLAKLPIPSVSVIAFFFIAFLTVQDLATDEKINAWIASGAALTNVPWSSFIVPAILGGLAVYELAKMVGIIGKTDYYGNLEGQEVGSLSQQAAEWALAGVVPTRSADDAYDVATFAGGCFWGTELHFQRIPGVIATCVGYTQGRTERPSYGQVCSGTTGHTEGIQMLYDPAVVSYAELCDKLLSTVDSTAWNRVGNDTGTQYRHGIYPHTDAQMAEAVDALDREQERKGMRKVVTEVQRAEVFWPAEKYHQRFLQKGGQSAEKGASQEVRCYG